MPNSLPSFFLLLYFFSLAKCNFNFSYNDDYANGPKNWPNLPGATCGGNRQSPIDLKDFTKVAEENSLMFDYYGKDITTAEIENSGHKIRIYLHQQDQRQDIMMFRGSFLITEYQLNWITFHWGRESGKGSEHHLNGETFALEMHLVHQRNHNAPSKGPNQYAVITIFFKVGDQTNDELKKITEKLAGVTKNGDKQSLPSLNVRKLMPEKGNLIRYNGSNTSPPCQEQTDWLIFEEFQFISDADLQQFVKCLDDKAKAGNFRPLQDLNGRTILRYTNMKYEHKEATTTAAPSGCNTIFKLHHFVFLFTIQILLLKF